jgi:hypothetical protein
MELNFHNFGNIWLYIWQIYLQIISLDCVVTHVYLVNVKYLISRICGKHKLYRDLVYNFGNQINFSH